MKIKHSKDMDAYFRRAMKNLLNECKNEFLGMAVSPANETDIRRKMRDAGFNEFTGPQNTWESLFISADAWENSLYHRTVDLSRISSGHFTYEKEIINGGELFNCDSLIKDPEHALNDSMKLRALDRDCTAVYLLQDDEDWMLDAPSEAATNDICAAAAHGNVLTFGLGIGYFLFMCAQNKAVSSITVIEQSQDVIDMFTKYIQPQMQLNVPVTIKQGDAYEHWNKDTLSGYDYVYTDIWQSSLDGLAAMQELLELYLPPLAQADFWIEDSCEETLWTLLFLHLRELYTGNADPVAEDFEYLMEKVRSYCAGLDRTITDPRELGAFIYDRSVLRSILAHHID